MEYIAHRVNTVAELQKLDPQYGVELDLRDDLNGRIYISHNPFETGEDLEDYLKEYRHGIMIANVKSERIEHKALEMFQKYQIEKFFFLDSTFPMIKLLSDMGERRLALRFSEFEGMDTIRNMAGKAEWIWVDCFSRMPLTRAAADEMKALGYKICIVSPELQRQPEKCRQYYDFLKMEKIPVDAVCAKLYQMEIWRRGE